MVEFALALMYQQRINWDDEIFEKSSKTEIKMKNGSRWKCSSCSKKIGTFESNKDAKIENDTMPKMIRSPHDVKDGHEKKNSTISKTNNIDFVAFILFNLLFFVFNYLYFRFIYVGTV